MNGRLAGRLKLFSPSFLITFYPPPHNHLLLSLAGWRGEEGYLFISPTPRCHYLLVRRGGRGWSCGGVSSSYTEWFVVPRLVVFAVLAAHDNKLCGDSRSDGTSTKARRVTSECKYESLFAC